MSQRSLSAARVVDAGGNPLQVVAEDEHNVSLHCADGTRLSIPHSLLEPRADGSILVPLVVQGAESALHVPVVEERLNVGKRMVETGRVRIRKTVHVHDEEVELPLAEEHIEVERVPRGIVLEGELPPAIREEGDTTVISVLEERLVVQKQWVLREELRVTRVRSERMAKHTGTLRSEQVDVSRPDNERQAPQ